MKETKLKNEKKIFTKENCQNHNNLKLLNKKGHRSTKIPC